MAIAAVHSNQCQWWVHRSVIPSFPCMVAASILGVPLASGALKLAAHESQSCSHTAAREKLRGVYSLATFGHVKKVCCSSPIWR